MKKLSLNRDKFEVDVIGNIVQKPKLIEETGSIIGKARIATNPRANKLDPKTGEIVPDSRRKKRRTFIELRIEKPSIAERFCEGIHLNDRIWVKGECETISIPKLFRSNQEDKLVTINVDVDEDGKNIVLMTEERLLMHVKSFGKIELSDGNPMLVYMQ